jgi:hypothetical protein
VNTPAHKMTAAIPEAINDAVRCGVFTVMHFACLLCPGNFAESNSQINLLVERQQPSVLR